MVSGLLVSGRPQECSFGVGHVERGIKISCVFF